jgi:hemerythrin
MKTSMRVAETNAFDLGNLDQEHLEIRRRYLGLEETILRGLGLPRILEAAGSLVQMMLLHFTHEEQFLVKFSTLQNRQRDANIEITAQLFKIEIGLEQEKTSTVFQLLLLSRLWMKEHMDLESDEFECEALAEPQSPFLMRGVLFGDTGDPSHHLPHAHLREQHSPHAASELNG